MPTTSAEKLLSKQIVTSKLSAMEWDLLRAGLKDRAFFSSKVESVRYLQEAQGKIADLLKNAPNADGAITSRAQVISDIMRRAREEGIATGKGGLTDPGSIERAKVIVDTNTKMAAGYADWLGGNSEGARLAFPAQELVRIEERNVERDWQTRWVENGGALYGGQMIALKEDHVWEKISRFGLPYPPFDFNSGMGVQDVDRAEAIALGVIDEDYRPTADPVQGFNASLEADMEFESYKDPCLQYLQNAFGDQIEYFDATKKLRWKSDIIQQMLADPSSAMESTRLGYPTPQCLRAAKEAGVPIPRSRLAIGKGHVVHIQRTHIGGAETDPRNIPLSDRELSLIPHVWRFPDRIAEDGEGVLFMEMDSSDGGIYRLVAKVLGSNNLKFSTFYKMKSR